MWAASATRRVASADGEVDRWRQMRQQWKMQHVVDAAADAAVSEKMCGKPLGKRAANEMIR